MLLKQLNNIMLYITIDRLLFRFMPNITDFRDFEAFKACRVFTREIGLLIRSVPLRRNRSLVDQNGEGFDFGSIQLC